MNPVLRRPSANRDLVAIFRHLHREAGLRVADRFFAAAEATFDRLARLPGSGTRYNPDDPTFGELRFVPIHGFREFLVFYAAIPEGIEVYRVLHGARDIPGILAEDFGLGDEHDPAAEEGDE